MLCPKEGTLKRPEELVVMYDSPEAASIQTVTGWVSRTGQFWGHDEHMARYCGATHGKCKKCGEVAELRSFCRSCQNALDIEKYNAMPREPWDGTAMIYSDAKDQYFSDPEEALDALEEGETLEGLRLVICEPNYLHELDSETWVDELPEDGELPDAVQSALDALNAAIRKAGPSSWSPGKTALDLSCIDAPSA